MTVADAEPLADLLNYIAAANPWPLSTQACNSAFALARATLGENDHD
jgi:hypothetical protein